MPSDAEVREAQRTTWAGLAAGWDKWDAVIMDQLRPVTAAMLEGLDVADHQEHLDVAAGTGEPGLTVARRAPHGRVVLTDLSAEMLAVAARRAVEQGASHVTTTVCSADALPFDDARFDSVTVRFGLMFFPDVPAALAELVRVLRPGGRLAAAVWVRPDANPWTSVLLDAVRTEVALPAPDPQGPGMFRLAGDGQVTDLYEQVGLREVVERDVPVELVTTSPQEYWEVMSEHVSLAVAALKQVDAAARERIAEAVTSQAARYEVGGRTRVPGLARCVVGTR